MNEKCENYCKNHECSRCGQCCAICIPITREEEKRIRNYVKENNIQPENLFENDNFYVTCCFYDRKNKCCKIYPARPNICQSFKCDRNENELEREKIDNHLRAYWNHIDYDDEISNLTTFDLLFYNDPRPLLEYLFRVAIPGEINEQKFEKVKEFLIDCGQKELAYSLKPIYEKE